MASNQKDEFANSAVISVTETAANTLTFKKLETGISLMEKAAWIIHRIEYTINLISAGEFNGDSDSFGYGISLSNAFASAALNEVTILDLNTLSRLDWGVAASGGLWRQPWVKEFTQLPGGGLIVPPNPIYLYAQGSGLVAANSVIARLWYTVLPLAESQFWQLVESRRVLSS